MNKLKAIIFDLDGVITDTAKFHFDAWSACARTLGINLSIEFEESLKGIDRPTSLKKILEFGNISLSEEQFENKLKEKNDLYVSFLQNLSKKDILPGIEKFLFEIKSHGLKLALASVSKNAPFILKKLELFEMFDYICDPSTLKLGKPDPEIFLNCANALNTPVNECVGIEDAFAGIESIKGGNMFAIGIGNFEKANINVNSTDELSLNLLKTYFVI